MHDIPVALVDKILDYLIRPALVVRFQVLCFFKRRVAVYDDKGDVVRNQFSKLGRENWADKDDPVDPAITELNDSMLFLLPASDR